MWRPTGQIAQARAGYTSFEKQKRGALQMAKRSKGKGNNKTKPKVPSSSHFSSESLAKESKSNHYDPSETISGTNSTAEGPDVEGKTTYSKAGYTSKSGLTFSSDGSPSTNGAFLKKIKK
jgi:hypothetical protein